MQKFPSEILAIVLSHLEAVDNVENMQVCRLWESTVRHYNLLQTVRLSKRTHLWLLFELLAKNRSLGSQTKQFTLDTDVDPFVPDISILPLLPNLKMLYTSSYTQILLDGQIDVHFVECQLEHLVINNHSENAYSHHALMRFPKLKTLTLNCEYFPHYYLMALLCSAPSLTELTFSSLDIQLDVMENIHSALPLLKSLIIYNSSLEFTQQLEEVHPCESITLFHTVFSCPSQGQGGNMEETWLNYIRLKYPNLTDFTFRSFTEESSIDLMATVVSMDNAHQYFLQLGNKLKKLDFYRSSIPSFYFDALDDNGYQLEEFNIVIGPYDNLLLSLFKSNQANSIQKLTLKNVDLNLLARLATMRLLNDLTLDSDGSEVMSCIGNIVRICPLHLKSLTLKSLTLYWQDLQPRLESVERLHFVNVMFDKYVDSNINIAFPSTKTLKIENCYFSFNKVHLLSFDLLRLEVARRASFCSKHMVVKTSKDNSQATFTVGYPTSNHQDLKHYSVLCKLPLYPPTKRMCGPPKNERIFLELSCYAARNVTVFF